jgi:CRP-like cAMP-binding protein
MQRLSNAKTGNRLVDAMQPAGIERLKHLLEPVALPFAEPLDPAEYAYFPVEGFISVAATMKNGASVGVGMTGRDGMYSVYAVLGEDTPLETATVQLPGHALRVKADLLREEMQANGALRKLLLRYTQARINAIAQSAACNQLHLLEQRCARWILACHDPVEADRIRMTHEFLATMLGVPRGGVTLAMQFLQKNGLIAYSRRTMAVLDRQGLEAVACECYRVIQDGFDRVFTASPRASVAAD